MNHKNGKELTQEEAAVLMNEFDEKLHARLSAALVRLCVHDGDEASSVLSVKFSNLNAQLNNIKLKLQEGMEAESVLQNVDIALNELVEAFMQLQFFDRVAQRLDHAAQSAELIDDPMEAMPRPMSSRFTMEDERILFEALQGGASITEAVALATSKLDDTLDKSGEDDIELF